MALMPGPAQTRPASARRWATPARTRGAWRALLIVGVIALATAGSWFLKARDNALIVNAQALAQGAGTEPERTAPNLLFAQAHELATQEQAEAALVRYRLLYPDPSLGAAARYNSANLMLRQGLALRGGDNAAQALPLIELAKQSYRQVLRAEPEHWDARYNYERAQRAQPDPDQIDAPIGEPRAQAERSPTTTRGVGGGMP
jgi:mxaK protein